MQAINQLILATGGARSGKSAFAEQLAMDSGGRVTYLATAQALDEEMVERIAHHRARRPSHWRTVECPLDPATAIRTHAEDTDCFLLDCLALLTSNLLLANEGNAEEVVERSVEEILRAHADTQRVLIIVSNEVGLGLVPEYPLGRLYRDLLGRANQRIAAAADAVYFLVAGIPLEMKSLSQAVQSTIKSGPHPSPSPNSGRGD